MKNLTGKVAVSKAGDGALVVRIEAPPVGSDGDGLVPFPFGLERAAATALMARGLRTVRWGRRRYCKRSELLALFDAEAATKPPPAKASGVDVAGDLKAIAARARRAG